MLVKFDGPFGFRWSWGLWGLVVDFSAI